MKRNLNKYREIIILKMKKLLNLKNNEQLNTEEKKYIVACFFEIATIEEFKLLNMTVNKSGLPFNSDLLYILKNNKSYISNKIYFKKYLRGE